MIIILYSYIRIDSPYFIISSNFICRIIFCLYYHVLTQLGNEGEMELPSFEKLKEWYRWPGLWLIYLQFHQILTIIPLDISKRYG